MTSTPFPKKILVTGSNGLLGQKLTDLALADERIALVATSRGANRHPAKGGYTYIDLDILDINRLRAAIAEHRPQAIVNTAAMTNVDACEHDPERSEEHTSELQSLMRISSAVFCLTKKQHQ